MHGGLEILPAGNKGVGVFAKGDGFLSKSFVLSSPVLVIKKKDRPKIEESFLGSYAFYLERKYMIALSVASLLNHSDNPNLEYAYDKETNTINFYADRNIYAGEELTIDYGWDSYPWIK